MAFSLSTSELGVLHFFVFPLINFNEKSENRMINYNHRSFRPIQNTHNGETSLETLFYYKQEGNIISSEYKGGRIIHGHLIGLVNEDGCIEMCYHQVNINNEIMTGKCSSRPEILVNGKIRLHETWQWTSGDFSSGTSIIEEI
jgi:hypothetical protein